MRPAGQTRRLSPGVVVLPVDVAPQAQVGVCAKGPVERPPPIKMGERLTVDRNHAHAGAVGQLPLNPCDGESIRWSDVSDLARFHAQKTELVPARVTG